MKLLNLPFVFVLYSLLHLCVFSANAQNQINCGSVSQKIPQFIPSDSLNDHSLFLIKRKILPTITQAKSDIEIRLFDIDIANKSSCIVINCEGNKFTAAKYISQDNKIGLPILDKSFKDIGPVNGDTSYTVLLSITKGLKPEKAPNWDALFKELIQNHLFDIPGEPEFSKTILKLNPGIWFGRNDGFMVIEIKVHQQYRMLTYNTNFSTDIKNTPINDYLKNILRLLYNFN